jgi:hypothetical protein
VDAMAGQIAHVTFGPEPPMAAAVPAPVPAATSTAPGPAATESQAPENAQSSRPISTPRIVATAALGGVAVVATGLGAYFAFQSRTQGNTVANYRVKYGTSACAGSVAPLYCGPWNDAVKVQNRDVTASDVLYIAAGALAVAAIVTWFAWPNEARPAAAWISPSLGPAGAGVHAGGRF